MKSPKRKPAAPPAAAADGYRLEEQVGFLLRKAHQRASAIFQTTIGDPSVTPTQYSALVKLSEQGELSQNHLGRLIAVDPATIQGVVRRLGARRLIARQPDRKDRRRTRLALSPAGRALVAALRANGPAVSSKTLAPLSAAEQAVLLALLARLG
jgi:DNA-binding MarR family transcriptional regulator